MTRNSLFTLSLLAAFSVVGLVSPAAADSCGPVYDALTKIVTTPSHRYSTQTAAFLNGKTRSTETTYVQGKTYMIVKAGGGLAR